MTPASSLALPEINLEKHLARLEHRSTSPLFSINYRLGDINYTKCDVFQCNLNVIEKELMIAPKFVERFTTVTVKEGEPLSFSARAVGTPVPRISWQKVRIMIAKIL